MPSQASSTQAPASRRRAPTAAARPASRCQASASRRQPASPPRLRAAGSPRNSAGDWAVETHGLTKRFGATVAVDDVELLVPRGSAFGYLGPNGAGKTTLIRTLLGLTKANGGTMSLLGTPVPAERGRALAKVGAIVDEPRFHPHLTGQENLRLLAAARGGDAHQRIAPSLARVGLTGRADDKVASYSMGMRQRLGVAACLLSDPELLILDEPMNGLDPAGMHEMRAMITSLADEGRTVVLSSHLLDEIERTCDAVAIVDHGRVIRQGPIDELTRGAGGGVVQVECAEPARAAQLIAEAGLAAGTALTEDRADRHPAPGCGPRAHRRPQPPAGQCRDRRVRPPRGPDVAGGLVLVRDEPTGGVLVTTTEPSLSQAAPAPGHARPARPRTSSWLPTWDLITTKNLEIRKRRGLMITMVVLIIVPDRPGSRPAAAVPRGRPGHQRPGRQPGRFPAADQPDRRVRLHRRRRPRRGRRDHRPVRWRVPPPRHHRPVPPGPLPGPHPGRAGYPGPARRPGFHAELPRHQLRRHPESHHGRRLRPQRPRASGRGRAADLAPAASPAGHQRPPGRPLDHPRADRRD